MAKITSETGEYVHCKLGVELGKKFHEYYSRTGIGKTAVVAMLIGRFLKAREQGNKSISVTF
jgi:hypothetical protein